MQDYALRVDGKFEVLSPGDRDFVDGNAKERGPNNV